MIRNLLKKLLVPICFLGVIGFITLTIFGQDATIVKEYTNSFGQTMYRIDLRQYLENMETTIAGTEVWQALEIKLPTTPANNANQVINILIYLVNIVILLINVTLLLPIKIIIYPLSIIFSLAGLDLTNNGLYETLITIAGFNISYIPLI